MQIWIRERTDFIATTEKRLKGAAEAITGGILTAILAVIAAFGVSIGMGYAMLALNAYYGAHVAPPTPPGLGSFLGGAAALLMIGIVLAIAGLYMLLFASKPVDDLHAETLPLKYLAPQSVTEIALPAGDTR